MKKILISFILLTAWVSTFASTTHPELTNINLLQEQYRDFLEAKDVSLMSKYIDKNVKFYRDFNTPENYQVLYDHVITQNKKCVKLKILPFDQIIASGNKVVTTYTLRCTDKYNVIHKTKVASIAEINNKKVTNFWQVTHNEN